jgi:hypothetical protein
MYAEYTHYISLHVAFSEGRREGVVVLVIGITCMKEKGTEGLDAMEALAKSCWVKVWAIHFSLFPPYRKFSPATSQNPFKSIINEMWSEENERNVSYIFVYELSHRACRKHSRIAIGHHCRLYKPQIDYKQKMKYISLKCRQTHLFPPERMQYFIGPYLSPYRACWTSHHDQRGELCSQSTLCLLFHNPIQSALHIHKAWITAKSKFQMDTHHTIVSMKYWPFCTIGIPALSV